VKIVLDDMEAMRPLVVAVARQVAAEMMGAANAIPDGRLAYSEAEAASMLGLNPHQLRDERRRGRIAASVIVGNRVRYSRDDLVGYLAARRTGKP